MKTTILILAVIAAQTTLAAIEIKSDTANGSVQFEAIGRPAMIKIKGEGDGASSILTLNQNNLSGEISFNLSSLKTGIGLRDEHMKEKYLQVKTNPVARLALSNLQLPSAWTLQNPLVGSQTFKGKLLLHGVEREVTGVYTIENQQLKSNAQFEIKLSDFKIDIPSYLGVKVADSVKVTVNFEKMNLIKKN